MSAHCDCHHEHCRKLVKPPQPTTYPLTMENLEKGVKNINTIIDMIDTRQDENREQMMVFLKIFCDDLISKLKENNSNVNNSSNTKEPEMPINERINKTLIQLLQLKPAVITKYGSELLDKVWELNDDINEYIPPEEILNQPVDKRLTPLELMKYFLQLFFGQKHNIENLLKDKYIIIDEEKRKININEEKCKDISTNSDKYINDNNLLNSLMIIKILTYVNPD